MNSLQLDIRHLTEFVNKEEIRTLYPEAMKHRMALQNKTGKGSDFLGWTDLPAKINAGEIEKIEKLACRWKNNMDTVVMVGIGGSYLGARFVIEALSHTFPGDVPGGNSPRILFAGQNISEDYLHDLLEVLSGKSFGLIVISKSGTTTEPALAFRILKNELVRRFGKKSLSERIIAITDAQHGALRKMAEKEGYPTFSIPDDVGGRYSVLTPVGLVPIAMAGFHIKSLLKGAGLMMQRCDVEQNIEENPAALYAIARNLLYRKGKRIEILVNYEPRLHYMAEWWKQLFGESEGKEGKGLFPASVDFTTDLHSMGQYIQEGERHLFETVVSLRKPLHRIEVPVDENNLDTLNYLAGKRIHEVNEMAEMGTTLAHRHGGVPIIRIIIPEINETILGQMIYFFEMSCALSGYLLGINPFNQPGVEAYKKNMFALLSKPGYEKEGEELRKILT